MVWLFKLAGLLTVFLVCTLGGFFKSMSLKRRHLRLCGFYRSMSELRERIRMGSGEIERLVELSFEKGAVLLDGGKAQIDGGYLEREDAALLEEFFRDLGMSDSDSEYERTGLYMALVKKKCEEAEEKCGELCRLYSALGILCGIFICIFLL